MWRGCVRQVQELASSRPGTEVAGEGEICWRRVSGTGGTEVDPLDRPRQHFKEAQGEEDSLERYRLYQTVRQLLLQAEDPFATPILQTVEGELAKVRPQAGRAQLERLIQDARAPADLNLYREAYDRLGAIRKDAPELEEFGLGDEEVRQNVGQARYRVLAEWKSWAEDW